MKEPIEPASHLKVSLVATVKDAAPFIGEFLASVRSQTRPPDEVLVVDGGSSDGTLDLLQDAGELTVIEAPGANIARGRNLAVAAATHDVIAVTDADCGLEPDWLERLLEPIAGGADVSMGFYRPVGDSLLQVCMASVLPTRDEVRAPRFMPSARSLAFLREAFDAAGGYPEWLDVGEDMHLNHRWRGLGLRMELASDAMVRWRIRPTLGATWRQYVGYARGDAIAGMHARRHTIRFAVYGAAVAVLASRRALPLAAAAVAGAAYVRRPVRRATRLATERGRSRVAAAVFTPAAIAFIDAAKMAGYVAGLRRRWRQGNGTS
jgi:glycosyltransferase involved in cell wall biosynthesis